MTEIWIVNASPIIVLAKIDKLDLLSTSGRIVMVPEAVAREILQAPAQDAARRALESGWGSQPVPVTPEPEVLEWGLGAGESAVLSLAKQRRAVAIVDDKAARMACKALNIRLAGTLGLSCWHTVKEGFRLPWKSYNHYNKPAYISMIKSFEWPYNR